MNYYFGQSSKLKDWVAEELHDFLKSEKLTSRELVLVRCIEALAERHDSLETALNRHVQQSFQVAQL